MKVLTLALLCVAACGGSGPPGAAPAPRASASAASSAAAGKRHVFDAQGHAQSCETPRKQCPEATQDTRFTDRCKLAGFRVILCGCDMVCTGDVTASSRYYDPSGNARECAAARSDCTAPPASAAFQDACSGRAHRLEQCGCEWLCSGNPTK